MSTQQMIILLVSVFGADVWTIKNVIRNISLGGDESEYLGMSLEANLAMETVFVAPSVLLQEYMDLSSLYVFTFAVPPDASLLIINTVAVVNSPQSFGGRCTQQNATVHFKYGSMPIVANEGLVTPAHYLSGKRWGTISATNSHTVVEHGPMPGTWYGAAYLDWTGKTSWMERRGFHKAITDNCQTYLVMHIDVKKEIFTIITSKTTDVKLKQDDTAFYKYLSSDIFQTTHLYFRIKECLECLFIIIRVAMMTSPTATNSIIRCLLEADVSGAQNVSFFAQPTTWYYVEISRVRANEDGLARCTVLRKAHSFNVTLIDMVKEASKDRFRFDLVLPPWLGLFSREVRVPSTGVTVKRFTISPTENGGTLTFAFSMQVDDKFYTGYRRPMDDLNSTYIFEPNEDLIKMVVCLHHAFVGYPMPNETCLVAGRIHRADLVVKNIDMNTIGDYIHIPYPEQGVWYIAIRLFAVKVPRKGRSFAVPLDKDDQAHLKSSSRLQSSRTPFALKAMFTMTSAPCVLGGCSKLGDCVHFLYGDVTFSGCMCDLGYSGHDCSDLKYSMPYNQAVFNTIILVSSNIFFAIPILLAVARQYYTEAACYTCTMAISMAYHACDEGRRPYGYCVLQHHHLSYADFYAGYLSFWITLVAVASLDYRAVDALHTIGAVYMAVATAVNRRSLYTYMIPSACICAVIAVSWTNRALKSGRLFPSKHYYAFCLPVAAATGSTGLYLFFAVQNAENYQYVHSTWHALIATCLAMLLPNPKSFYPAIETRGELREGGDPQNGDTLVPEEG